MATLVLSLYPCRCLSVCCFARKFMSKCQHCHANGTMFERCGTQRQTHTRAQGRSCNWIVYGAPCHMPHPLIGEISLLAMSSFPLQVPIDQSHLADRPHSHPFGSLWANRLSKCWTWHKFVSATCNLQLRSQLTTWGVSGDGDATFQRAHLCLQFMLPDWLTCAHQSHGDPGHLLTWFSFWCQLRRPHPLPMPLLLHPICHLYQRTAR